MTYDVKKVDKTEDISFVKVELTLKSSIIVNASGELEKEVTVASGFLVGVLHRVSCSSSSEICEQYIVLTKDFKSFEIYNTLHFYIMSIVYKVDNVQTILVYKTYIEDQKSAGSLLYSIMENLKENKKTDLDDDVIDLSKYNITETELLFLDEDGVLSNIESPRAELRKKAENIVIGVVHKNNSAVVHKPPYQSTVAGWAQDNLNRNNNNTRTTTTTTSVKEPMFFKRTKSRPSKKLLDKLKEFTILVSENNLEDPNSVVYEKVCVACEGSRLNSKGGVCRVCDGTGIRIKAKNYNKDVAYAETETDPDYDDYDEFSSLRYMM